MGTVPNPGHLCAVARALEVSLDWLVGTGARAVAAAYPAEHVDALEQRLLELWRASDDACRALALSLLASASERRSATQQTVTAKRRVGAAGTRTGAPASSEPA
jgi:hypothetical protein